MKLSYKILVPEVRFECTNEEATVSAMTAAVEKSVVARTQRGTDADGAALPRAKDAGTEANPDGRPLQRTGTLVASIGSVIRTRNGKPYGVVRAFGDRPANEDVKAKVARARIKTAAMRRVAIEEARRDEIAGVTPRLTKRGGKFSAGRIRVRAVTTNAALAAVLSQPPKDARGQAGGRAIYVVFRATDDEQEKARDVARKTMRVRLVQVGTREVK